MRWLLLASMTLSFGCGGDVIPDAGSDASIPDGGSTMDASAVDAGLRDAGPLDAGSPDAGPAADAGSRDAGRDAGDPAAILATTLTSYYVPSAGFRDFDKTQPAAPGEPVLVLVDELGVSGDIRFRGDLTHTPEQRIPRMPSDQAPTLDPITGALFLPNVLRAHYFSDAFPDRTTPFEIWAVVRSHRSQPGEAIFASGSRMQGLRLRGLDRVNWGINGTSIEEEVDLSVPPYLQKTVIRMRFDGDASELFYDGRGLGPATISDMTLRHLGFGSNGHGQNHELFLFGYVDGTLSDAEASTLLDALRADDPEFGALPQDPVAVPTEENGGALSTRIVVYDRVADEWQLEFDVNAESGRAEDPSRRRFQWYIGDRESTSTGNFLDSQRRIEGATDATLVRADYAIGNGRGNPEIFPADGTASDRFYLSCGITVFDAEGRTFGEVQTNWTLDNID